MNALTAIMPPDEHEADEYLSVPAPPGYQIDDDEDGGLTISIMGGDQADEPRIADQEFYSNLADGVLPQYVLQSIVTELLQKIDEDKQSCEDRDKQYEDGLRRTGMGKDAPGGAPFTGASKVVHPMLTEACIDFQSRVMKELWRPSGPCRPNVTGDMTKDRFERAKRKADYMNWQLTRQIKEARAVIEKMLSQVPLGGSQFIRLWWDPRLRRPRMKFIPVDSIYIPGSAESYETANRRTFTDTISAIELKNRQQSGMYADVNVGPAPDAPEKSKAGTANEKIEGVKPPGLNIDGDREIYETMVVLEVSPQMADHLDYEEEGELYPYLLTIDVRSRAAVAMYRDWEENDDTREAIDHLFPFGFIPWRGPYDVGLPHALAGLPGAATGALRALLDSAMIANAQGGLILKGSGVGAQARTPNPNEFIEIESGMETSDIRQKVMPFATKEPSAVLFQLLGFIVEAAKGTVRTSMDDKSIDANSNVPVGTQLSRVEEGLTVFTAIHGRIHASFNRLLDGLHRLDRMYLPKTVTQKVQGKELRVRRRDFDGDADVIPVSEPTICSDQVRMGQVQAMQARAAMVPGLYNAREVESWFLDLMKVPDKDRFLTPQPKPMEMNAVNENVAMALGRPVVAFPDQDHLAHLQVLLDFMQSPILGMNPLISQTFLPSALKHATEHLVYYYVRKTTDTIEGAAGVSVTELFSDDQDVRTGLDQLLAKVSSVITPSLQGDFAKAIPVIQKAMQMVKSLMPPQPIDPSLVAQQAAQAETQRKTGADQAKAQGDQAKTQLAAGTAATRAQNDQVRNAIDMERVQAMKDNADASNATKVHITDMDNQTAENIAMAEIISGHKSGLSTGASMRGS